MLITSPVHTYHWLNCFYLIKKLKCSREICSLFFFFLPMNNLPRLLGVLFLQGIKTTDLPFIRYCFKGVSSLGVFIVLSTKFQLKVPFYFKLWVFISVVVFVSKF